MRKILPAVLAVVFVGKKAMNMNSKVTRQGRSGYTQTCKGYFQGNTQTSVCRMKWQSVQFSPLDKSDEAECAIF